MEEKKYLQELLKVSQNPQLKKYKKDNLFSDYFPFEGTPKKHPEDQNILILLTNPLSIDEIFYEFSLDSIGNIEELETITTSEGKSYYKIRVWVKRGMPALRSEPFIVN